MAEEEDSDKQIQNTRLLTYDIKVGRFVRNKVRMLGYRDESCLNVLVTNLIACIRKKQVLVYSRRRSGVKSNKKSITVGRVIKAVNFLEDAGYILHTKGTPHPDKEKRKISFVQPTGKFLLLFELENVMKDCENAYAECYPVIELRNAEKEPITYRNNEEIEAMEALVRKLNEINEKAVVCDADGNNLTNMYCRIFNESFAYGGRFYKADVLRLKHKKTQDRYSITINGEPVTEVDYSNLHFRIAAAKEKLDLDDGDIPLDVYGGILDNSDNHVDREMVKLAVNIMFNAFSEEKAAQAIRGEINLLSKEDKLLYSLGRAESLMDLIYQNYPDFVELFCNGDSYGRRLQNDDSNLAADILSVFVDKEIPILPVHDSFVVAERHEELLIQTMGDCFRNRFGIDTLVPVTVSFKQDGTVYKNHILA